MVHSQQEGAQAQSLLQHAAKDSLLSSEEAALLNTLLEHSRDTFDFQGKKIAFITGSSGSRKVSKTDYFEDINAWLDAGKKPQISMEVLRKEEQMISGGYDAFVLSWVKVLTNRQRKRMVEQLGKEE